MATRRTRKGVSRRRAAARPGSSRSAGAARTIGDPKLLDLALRNGRERAQTVLDERQRRAARRRKRARAGAAGLLVAFGDSWFDYPFFDVVEELEEGFGYDVDCVAHHGETAEQMAYEGSQLDKLARRLEKLARAGRVPQAFLLSCGGNDIAGDEFAMLLNHKGSALPPLNDAIVAGAVDQRIRIAIASVVSAIAALFAHYFPGVPQPRVLIHGYDYPVPDGRGYLGGFWLLPGPWLEPGFRYKGYGNLEECCQVMEALIDRFNAVLAGMAGSPGLEPLQHVDLRGLLSNSLPGGAYKAWWNDELHPTEKGFAAVAGRFDQAIRGA